MIGAPSRRGILFGTAETAGHPALYAATSPDARSARLYGPSGPGNLGGRPGEQKLYAPLHSISAARRVWEVSEELTAVSEVGGLRRRAGKP